MGVHTHMRGRKPVPTALKLVRGNPGRRPIPTNEFRPEPSTPSCPPHLGGEGKREWRRLAKLLGGVITQVDRSTLAMICTCWERYLLAEGRLTEGEFIVQGALSRPMPSPWLAISNRAIELHTRLCVEFGLTPASRTRIRTCEPVPQPRLDKGKGWDQFT